MKQFIAALLMSCTALAAHAEIKVGAPAPAFSRKDAAGQTHELKDLRGKWVVLEWTNKDCPFVKKHYGSGNMQKLQKTYTAKGVTWLSVITSAKGKQGYLEPADAPADQTDDRSVGHGLPDTLRADLQRLGLL